MTLINTPCVIVRRTSSGETTIYGDDVLTETLVDAVCDIQQQARSEEDGAISETVWRIYFPIGTVVDAGDAVLDGDVEYELVGEPWVADQGSASVNHIEATARRSAGVETPS